MKDRIAKQRLNVFLLIDSSTSMRGERISQVNKALRDIKASLISMQQENTNVDFYLTVVTFSTDARLLNNDRMKNVEDFDFKDIWAGGWSNLHLAYKTLDELLVKESKGGIMPDFGGVAPIILLLTDGHPTGEEYKEELENLKKKPWFNVALRYGIAIELNDERTKNVLKEFVGNNGDVIDCFDATKLKNIIKVIVLTASKVKSSSANVNSQRIISSSSSTEAPKITQNEQVQMEVSNALNEVEEWEW